MHIHVHTHARARARTHTHTHTHSRTHTCTRAHTHCGPPVHACAVPAPEVCFQLGELLLCSDGLPAGLLKVCLALLQTGNDIVKVAPEIISICILHWLATKWRNAANFGPGPQSGNGGASPISIVCLCTFIRSTPSLCLLDDLQISASFAS